LDEREAEELKTGKAAEKAGDRLRGKRKRR
jgi:hypothetical protein